MKDKIIKSVIAITAAFLLFFIPDIKLPYLDSNADEYFETAMSKATVAYGTTRVINASVSVLKDSEVHAEPGGIGLSLAIGEILDPIDDMTERVSDVLITAIVSLGIQKLICEIGISIVPKLLAIIIVLYSILAWTSYKRADSINQFLVRLGIIILVVRLFLPFSALVNDILNYSYFDARLDSAKVQLEYYTSEITTVIDLEFPEGEGVWETIRNSADFLKKTSIKFKDALVAIVDNASDIVESLLQLTWLYFGLFVIQVILLPMLMFWLMVKLINNIFDTNIPLIIKHSAIKSKLK
jgi:hypothetical protein